VRPTRPPRPTGVRSIGLGLPPRRRLLLAGEGSQALGCVALRPVDADICEMQRLYVHPAGRGERLGRRLAERVCEEAHAAGYRRICLDRLPEMTAAVALYRSMGFRPSDPDVCNPLPDVLFLGLDLSDGS